MNADFYNQKDFPISTRSPLSIVSDENPRELAEPIEEPVTDIFQELWQFSHITVSFAGRVFIAACLLAYGVSC